MSIPSNSPRPHVMGLTAPIARDGADPLDRDAAIRMLIDRLPEEERAQFEDLILGGRELRDGADDAVHKPSIPAQDAALFPHMNRIGG